MKQKDKVIDFRDIRVSWEPIKSGSQHLPSVKEFLEIFNKSAKKTIKSKRR